MNPPGSGGFGHRGNLDRFARGCNSPFVAQKHHNSSKGTRPPRIRVPNRERALFTADDHRFVGIVQRLSLTGGSAVLSKGPIPMGTFGIMDLNTVFGKVSAHIEFLQTGADGVPLAQAFRFLSMDDQSSERFIAAAKQMEREGFSDAKVARKPPSRTLDLLLSSVRRLAATMSSRSS